MFQSWMAIVSELYAHWLEQIDAAEALGFDSLWATEHHFRHFGGMLPNPQLLLTAAAQRTKRIRLGAAVCLLPMHHPLQVAEDFAMLDLLSDGRVNFGAGRGMHPLEYATFNADWNTAQLRLPEALDIVVRAWTGGEFEWNGEHYRYPKLSVYPKPHQKPHPPIYVTANRDPESFQLIGRRGYNLMTLPWIATNELQRTRMQTYFDALREGGHVSGIEGYLRDVSGLRRGQRRAGAGRSSRALERLAGICARSDESRPK